MMIYSLCERENNILHCAKIHSFYLTCTENGNYSFKYPPIYLLGCLKQSYLRKRNSKLGKRVVPILLYINLLFFKTRQFNVNIIICWMLFLPRLDRR